MEEIIKTDHITLELGAVIVSVNSFNTPEVLVVTEKNSSPKLPSGSFDPVKHKTLELGVRNWIVKQTPFKPGYVEQLYTFGNEGRVNISDKNASKVASRVVSVGYLALTWREDTTKIPSPENAPTDNYARWDNWYSFFPWEDLRDGKPEVIENKIVPALNKWADKTKNYKAKQAQLERIAVCFAQEGLDWDFERVLERYELLYEARLIEEVYIDKNLEVPKPDDLIESNCMKHDHRRMLATAINRLRGKLKYRPVIFELMPESFTLLQLQRTIESIGGYKLHKQNFRRLLENNKLVEETGQMSTKTGGRPAALFKFRKGVLLERIAIGVKMSPTT